MKIKKIAAGLSLVAIVALGVAGNASPASAQTFERGQCGSDRNLQHVRRTLEAGIDQLSHDQSDYGGHKAGAMSDLANARGEIRAAIRYQRSVDPAFDSCTAGDGQPWNAAGWTRGQYGSDANIYGIHNWVRGMIAQLNHDDRDYDGHRVAAIGDMQAAEHEMIAAERFAHNHGY